MYETQVPSDSRTSQRCALLLSISLSLPFYSKKMGGGENGGIAPLNCQWSSHIYIYIYLFLVIR